MGPGKEWRRGESYPKGECQVNTVLLRSALYADTLKQGETVSFLITPETGRKPVTPESALPENIHCLSSGTTPAL